MSPFDEADWPPILVLAWMWLRDRTVVDDPNLSTRRLAIHGARRQAPIEIPAPDPIEPEGLDLAPAPKASNPGLTTLRAAEDEIRAASRSGRLPWTGRFAELGARKELPVLAFVEGVMDYDSALLAGPIPGLQIWHALRAERVRVLDLWPETSVTGSSQSAQPRPRRSVRQIVQDYIAAAEQAGRVPRLSELHRQHPDLSQPQLRAVWPHDEHPLKRGRPKKI
jgi:hypothetical protein